jgi:anti-sigma regulatory factor (Ser/Thr protein kinase)
MLSLGLSPRLAAGQEARQFLRERLREQLSEDLLDDLIAVVTELVNNSVQHGPDAPIQLRVALTDDGGVRGEVEDQGNDADVAISDSSRGLGGGGLGLLIVDSLTDRWGAHEGSTIVWFELSVAA